MLTHTIVVRILFINVWGKKWFSLRLVILSLLASSL